MSVSLRVGIGRGHVMCRVVLGLLGWDLQVSVRLIGCAGSEVGV